MPAFVERHYQDPRFGGLKLDCKAPRDCLRTGGHLEEVQLRETQVVIAKGLFGPLPGKNSQGKPLIYRDNIS